MGTLNSTHKDNTGSILILPIGPVYQHALDGKLLSVGLPRFAEPDPREGRHTWVRGSAHTAQHGEQVEWPWDLLTFVGCCLLPRR